MFVSFVSATLVALVIGWFLWRHDKVKQVLDPYLIVLYAMPIFVFYPMFIIVFGLNVFLSFSSPSR